MNFFQKILPIHACLILLGHSLFNITSEGFLEGNYLDCFKKRILPRHQEWNKKLGNYVVHMSTLIEISNQDDIPYYYSDISLKNSDLTEVTLRFFTKMDLEEFIGKIHQLITRLNLAKIFEEKGLYFDP